MNKVVNIESNSKINRTISLNVCWKIIEVRVGLTAIKLTYICNTTQRIIDNG